MRVKLGVPPSGDVIISQTFTATVSGALRVSITSGGFGVNWVKLVEGDRTSLVHEYSQSDLLLTAKVESVTSFFGGTMGGASTEDIMEALNSDAPFAVTTDPNGKKIVVASNLFAENLASLNAFIDQLTVKKLKTHVENSTQRVEALNNQLLVFDGNDKVCASLTGDAIPSHSDFSAGGSSGQITIPQQAFDKAYPAGSGITELINLPGTLVVPNDYVTPYN